MFNPGDYVEFHFYDPMMAAKELGVGIILDMSLEETDTMHLRSNPGRDVPVKWVWQMVGKKVKGPQGPQGATSNSINKFFWNNPIDLRKLDSEEAEYRILMYVLAHGGE